ncbi:YceH family protein [Aminobacter sp. UC22_36]|uniref:YceH family protein n=1 Tax=Aminobacter sp. UC22_36 TaxID=3374549 RepID=UPI0037580210
MTDTDLPHLTPVEARVLGCLIEKKELTPDVYPMTSNALVAAANQKTSREPVMALEIVDITRALGMLQAKGLAKQQFASRVERYEHQMAQKFSLTRNQSTLIGLLLLRGPQTVYELQARTERMANFADADALRGELDMLIGRRPALVKEIGRAPGQREDRFAHLLSGDVDAAVVTTSRAPSAAAPVVSELEERVRLLEEEVAALKARLDAVGG